MQLGHEVHESSPGQPEVFLKGTIGHLWNSFLCIIPGTRNMTNANNAEVYFQKKF